jgi:chromosome segregation ATPase
MEVVCLWPCIVQQRCFCRDQLKKEVVRLQQGLGALFEAIKKPTSEMMKLQSEQIALNGVATELDRTKAEVTSSISQLAAKCSQMDKQLPELRDKLENVVSMISVRVFNHIRNEEQCFWNVHE